MKLKDVILKTAENVHLGSHIERSLNVLKKFEEVHGEKTVGYLRRV
jgi:hypothetical protein